jgi:PAS domain S-box-containing protein
MKKRSEPDDRWERLRADVIGLGERSFRKSYYPELQNRIEQLERFRSILDKTSDAIFIFTLPEGLITDVNESACRMLRADKNELLSSQIYDLIDINGTALCASAPWNTSESGATHRIIPGRIRRNADAPIPVEASVSSIVFDRQTYGLIVAREISERKRLEDSLSKSEEKYRTIIETTKTGFVIVNGDGMVLDANDEYVRLTGHSALQEILGRNVIEWTAEYDRERNIEAVRRCLNDGYIFGFEVDYIDSRGTTIPIEINARLVGAGADCQIITMCRNISDRKESERKLHQSWRTMQEIIEFLPDATFVIDAEKKVIAWNRALEEMTGVTKENILGKGDYAYSVPFYGEKRPVMIDLISMRNPEIESQYDFIDRQGDTIYSEVFVPSLYGGRGAFVSVKASPLFDEDGMYGGAIESVRDITANKLALEDIRKSEERFRSLISNSPVAISINDLNDTFTYVNNKFIDTFGYTLADCPDVKTWWRLAYPDREYRRRVRANWLNGIRESENFGTDMLPQEARVTCKNGIMKDIEFRYTVILDRGICFYYDITQRKRAEELLHLQRDLGIELNLITDLKEALGVILNRTSMVEGVDCGIIYLVDPSSGDLVSQCTFGLSPEDAERESFFSHDTANARIIMAGKPIYLAITEETIQNLGITHTPEHERFYLSLKSMAIIPVQHLGTSIAAINTGSRIYADIPEASRNALEAIGSMIGSTIVRLRGIEQIKASLREKEVLLKEIHHRVKNNLQIITSLLNLQSRNIHDGESLKQFGNAKNRVRAMALIHEKLYQNGDYARINLSQYIATMLGELWANYQVPGHPSGANIYMDDVILTLDQAIPCGLIINEVITNSLKYAFPGEPKSDAVIKISARRETGGFVEIIIYDNGIGMAEEVDIKNSRTFGLTLINLLTTQIGGTVTIDRNGGTRVTIRFKDQ